MKAIEINELSGKILESLEVEGMPIDLKIAALRAAAAILELIATAENLANMYRKAITGK
jgi:hypothetical protein